MNIRTVFIFATLAVLAGSCKSTSKTTSAEELNSKTEVTVREEKVKPVDLSNETLYRYYVIIGSFREFENVRQFNAGLAKDGFKPVILKNENGLFRVSVGAFDDERAARKKITKIRADSDKYDDVWLLVRK